MAKFLYHGESGSFFIAPDKYAEDCITCAELDYLDWVIGKTYLMEKGVIPNDRITPPPLFGGAAQCVGIAAYLKKFSIPQGFTTLDNNTYYFNRIDGEVISITLSKYDDYWQAQILDIIFPYIRLTL